jgi:hypothetical protein
VLGALVFSAFVIVVVVVVYASRAQRTELARLAVQSKWLNVTIGVLVAGFLIWAAVVIASDLLSRPRGMSRGQHAVATVFTTVVCVALAVPFVFGVRFATAQRGFIGDVFESAQQSFSPTRPTLSPNEDDPWSGQERVNVLLLGGDAARTGPARAPTRSSWQASTWTPATRCCSACRAISRKCRSRKVASSPSCTPVASPAPVIRCSGC